MRKYLILITGLLVTFLIGCGDITEEDKFNFISDHFDFLNTVENFTVTIKLDCDNDIVYEHQGKYAILEDGSRLSDISLYKYFMDEPDSFLLKNNGKAFYTTVSGVNTLVEVDDYYSDSFETSIFIAAFDTSSIEHHDDFTKASFDYAFEFKDFSYEEERLGIVINSIEGDGYFKHSSHIITSTRETVSGYEDYQEEVEFADEIYVNIYNVELTKEDKSYDSCVLSTVYSDLGKTEQQSPPEEYFIDDSIFVLNGIFSDNSVPYEELNNIRREFEEGEKNWFHNQYRTSFNFPGDVDYQSLIVSETLNFYVQCYSNTRLIIFDDQGTVIYDKTNILNSVPEEVITFEPGIYIFHIENLEEFDGDYSTNMDEPSNAGIIPEDDY